MELIDIIKKIKEKKELQGISDGIIKEKLEDFFSKNPKTKKRIFSSKKPEKTQAYKITIKKVRADLRKIHGSFHSKGFEKAVDNTPLKRILRYHRSTRERLKHYPEVYKKIFEITGKPKSVIDLGSGLNPVSFPINIKYYAYDINEKEINFLNKFFKLNKIKGRAIIKDIKKMNVFPKTDLCLLFKVVDLVDEKGHKNAEKILKKIKSKHIVVSFPTKTISGRKMKYPERGWIERLCERLNYKFEKLYIGDEIFYVIIKKKN